MSIKTKLADLAAKAGRWLGLAASPATPHTQVIESDRFDDMSWADTYSQANALRELADELADQHAHTEDLLRDAWTGAYKTSPTVRPRTAMDPSRTANHQVISALMDSPAFTDLRRDTVGDPYAAAMAVLAQSDALRDMLEDSREAQKAAQAAAEARQRAEQAAADVQTALEAARDAADPDGNVPEDVDQAMAAAIAAAEAADQTAQAAADAASQQLSQTAPGLRTKARAAAAQAAEAARAEAERMAAWGFGPGQLERMSFAERADLAQRLAGNRLGKFADLIGRFRAMATGERARRVEHTAGELVGVTLGDDLARLVPSELAALAVPGLRAEFASRLVEGRLMIYDSRGEDTAGKGAIIALIDCSGSMTRDDAGVGITREAWAKACALALLDQARAARRDFVGILFSNEDQQKLFDFPKGQADIAQVLEFGEHFYGGGTSFTEPLDQAADILAETWNVDRLAHGDIVLVTDGSCRVSDEWLDAWRQRKQKIGFRVFGVSVAHQPTGVLHELCDNLRTVTDLVDLDSSRDLFRLI
ncbi:VWA domain-containing protein [Nonomuraea sp. NPDC050790]|uniref:VWA domain-containing protein n=1 Tax=Nonomuraea sp. NPDC050790 TaxID=3364371 RepID=UPI00379A9377